MGGRGTGGGERGRVGGGGGAKREEEEKHTGKSQTLLNVSGGFFSP